MENYQIEERINQLIKSWLLIAKLASMDCGGTEGLGDYIYSLNKAQELGLALYELRNELESNINLDDYQLD